MHAIGKTSPANREQYASVRKQIQFGDILLFQGTGFVSQQIEDLTKGRYSHAALAAWWALPNMPPRLMVLEAISPLVAVRPASLSVDHYTGPVDWWQLKAEHRDALNHEEAFNAAMNSIGKKYSVGGLFRFLGLLLSGARRSVDKGSASVFCSQFVSECFRTGGLDPDLTRADYFTSPTDLARSGLWVYRETVHKAQ